MGFIILDIDVFSNVISNCPENEIQVGPSLVLVGIMFQVKNNAMVISLCSRF